METSNITVVLEGLPGLGKTTLANLLGNSGFEVVNESLGHLSPLHISGDQKAIFLETEQKYNKALKATTAVIDRGYPSLLAWDYCAEKLGYARNLEEKTLWVQQALQQQSIYEPTFYVYLKGNPELSLARRPRPEVKQDVWSGSLGMKFCLEYYEEFFQREHIKNNTITVNSNEDMKFIFNEVSSALRLRHESK